LSPAVLEAQRHRGRVLVAGVEGELHTLAANIVADMLQLTGWDVVYIGTHVPLAGILSAVAEHRPATLGVSTSMAFNLPRVVSLVEATRERFPALRVVLGGRALHAAPGLAAELGVEHDLAGDLAPFAAT
jgi:methanogenic corrinoid protein MtbC1